METMTTIDLIEDLQARQAAYGLFALLFRTEVTEEVLVALREEGALEAEGGLDEGFSLMRAYLASDGASILDLARDYAKVFCGAASTHKTAAYPFESVYTSDNGMLMQEARDGALAWYRRYGLAKSDSWHDCEDHVALELEFEAYLLGRLIEAVAEGNAGEAARLGGAQRDFAAEHLQNWIPEFSRHVQMRSRTDFYRGLGRALGAFVRSDAAEAEAVATALDAPAPEADLALAS